MLRKSIGAGTLWEVCPGVSDVQVQISLSGCPTADFCLELLFFCSSTDLIVIFGLASLLHPWYCRFDGGL